MVGQTLKASLAFWTINSQLRVFPLHDVAAGTCSCGDEVCSKNAGKHPRVADWKRESSKQFDRVFHRWWQKWPNANIGVPTGELNGCFVIDIDKQDVWEQLVSEYGDVPETLTYLTGSGGRHLWFRYPKGADITNRRSGFPYGVDIRGNGGYVVVPSSTTLKGPYRFDTEDGQPPRIRIAEAPEWILSLLTQYSTREGDYVSSEGLKSFSELDSGTQERYRRYVKSVLDSECERLSELGELGLPDWDNTTFLAACNIFEMAKAPWSPLTAEQAERLIRENAPSFDAEGWSEPRLNRIIDSAYSRIFSNEEVRPYPKNLERAEGKTKTKTSEPRADWDKPEAVERKLKLTPIADIPIEKIEWIWKDRIPLGELTLFAGREGIGKSVISAWMAAQVTKGLMEGELQGKPKAVLYFATEDSYNKTIAPRMIVAGADTNKVFRVELEHDEFLGINLPRDLDLMRLAIEEYDVGMMVLDPLVSFVDERLNTYKSRDVRVALEPLVRLAHDTNVAIIGLMHFNKSETANALDKVSESKAFTQVCRQTLMVFYPDDAVEGHLTNGKVNLAPRNVPALTYQIVSREIQTNKGPSTIGAVEFTGESHTSSQDLLQADSSRNAEFANDVREWLRETMNDYGGAQWSEQIFKLGRREGFTIDQLRRAQKKLGLAAYKVGLKGWIWATKVLTKEQAINMMDAPTTRQRQSNEQIKRLAGELDF